MTAVEGPDGRLRCGWANADSEYRRYHDEEWGVPLHGDVPLFEKLSLEGFQAGLSWITILRRRPAFREVFEGFQPDRVADMTDDDVARLMQESRIIRNRAKIRATIDNARVVRDLVAERPGALDELIWSHAPAEHRRPESMAEIPAVTPASIALSTALKNLGLRFVGPTTMYALMQSAGLVDDHLPGCWRSGSAGLSWQPTLRR